MRDHSGSGVSHLSRRLSARDDRGIFPGGPAAACWGTRPPPGTGIIEEFGAERQDTGKWIVYTSADSVFQIAAHEATVPLTELYAACRTAREILSGPPRGIPGDRAPVRGITVDTTRGRPRIGRTSAASSVRARRCWIAWKRSRAFPGSE